MLDNYGTIITLIIQETTDKQNEKKLMVFEPTEHSKVLITDPPLNWRSKTVDSRDTSTVFQLVEAYLLKRYHHSGEHCRIVISAIQVHDFGQIEVLVGVSYDR